MADKNPVSPGRGHQFGTFEGVFTPSILTILGVIMFLRAGFVVGQAGIVGAFGILIICEVIVVLTTLSIAAVATNTEVRGGGAYFLISRVLGPEFGGAIGLALFLALALSVPFYIIGFSEALVGTFEGLRPHLRGIAALTTLLLFALNYVGAGWAIRSQFLVMGILGLAIFSFLGGAATRFDPELFEANTWPRYSGPENGFWGLFAIYFPAVTGILAGVNLSGDLKSPGRSIVRGTFAAIAVGFAIYLLQILLCGGSASREDLVAKPYGILVENALLGTGYLVAAGVFSATLSSALGSFLGAPRVLQALARDRIVPGLALFGRGSRGKDEPHSALLLTLLLTLAVVYAATGEGSGRGFNVVASVVSMFFLCTYGIVNLAAFVESVGLNPSFRPRFRLFHWTTALAGTASCFVTMFLIDSVAATVAVIAIGAMYLLITRWVVRVAFGDARAGFLYASVTRNLLRLRGRRAHAKNWRPSLLILSGNPEKRLAVVRYGLWLEAGRGIVSVVQVLSGGVKGLSKRRETAIQALKAFLRRNGLSAFPEVVITSDFDEGLRVLVQAHSIGPIKPNVVLTGWPREEDRVLPFLLHVQDIRALEKSVLLLVDRGLPETDTPKRIDIWWRGMKNGALMAVFAHLLTRNWEWAEARVRILRVVENEAGREPARKALSSLIDESRIDAETVVVVSKEPFSSVLHTHSRDATVVFLGFEPPEDGQENAFFERYVSLLEGMPSTLLVCSSGEADMLA